MWILRFLNGPLAGQIVPLSKHSTLLGRAPNCDIKIPSANISKEHTRIEVFDDKLIISDAGSRNGTFLNGIQIRSTKAKSGDKVAIHEIFFEVQKVPDGWAQRFQQPYQVYGAPQGPQSYGNAAYQQHPVQGEPIPDDMPIDDPILGRVPRWANGMQGYMENVVLPGVYKLPEMFEFKWVLAGFMAGFIMLVTALSSIPLVQILKASIEEESQQHALTIATTLATLNGPALRSGQETGTTVTIASSRPGVSDALIISNVDGSVVAPASRSGTFPNMAFVHQVRKDRDREAVQQVDDSTVIAMVPVIAFNQETGSQTVTHWAVVQYDMSSLAVDNGRVLSLFITTLFIALILGFILFYFLYKMIEYPIRSMNRQLDVALKEGQDQVHITYQFPAMQLLASNVSSALNRILSGPDNNNAKGVTEHDRNREISNVVELIGFAAMGIRAHDLSIAAVNQTLETRLGQPAATLNTMAVNELPDQALKLSIKDLLERVDQNPDEMASNELEFSGLNYQIVAQAVYGTNKVAYYLIVLLPLQEGD